MTRHLIDHQRPSDTSRVVRYAALERLTGDEAAHPKIEMLLRRRKGESDGSRIKQFLRIERGHLA
ncbi:hypothetical protein [Anianabacter salinae]|uniref:hypothetical protein n=1 Tax=Anianabacter salinae TaxID=2851023 RepID=UPI00225DE50E|nr:hypothetical protein [Anianabacter salinae]MBV0913596.1 hypothetical protein [Anianabacter salinae]